MNWFEQFSLMVAAVKLHWRIYLLKGLLAIGLVLLIAGTRFIFRSSSLLYHISLLYLLVVLALAFLIGRSVALLAAVAAFICLDFFFVQPVFTLQINQSDDIRFLLLFLLVAVLMCLFVSEFNSRYYKTRMSLALEKQKNAEDTAQRARQMHILYDTVKETSKEKTLLAQLIIIARAIVANFGPCGVEGCSILLSDKDNHLSFEASWPQSAEMKRLLDDEEVGHTAKWVMANNSNIRITIEGSLLRGKYGGHIRSIVTRASQTFYPVRHYADIMPIPLINGNAAALLLVVNERIHTSALAQEQDSEWKQADLQEGFICQFIEHIVTVVEKARLQDEKLALELLQRTEKLHANLIKWVSHGIRTPLTTFLLETCQALDLLSNEEHPSERIRIALENIKDSADRLDHFVDDFLDMTRAKGGILKPQKSLYYIDDLVNETLEGLKSVIADRTVEINIPDDLPPLELDPTQIGHVLTNLIENAIRYTPPDSPIEVSAQLYSDHIRLNVADRGKGITPNDKRHLFDEFYQGKAASAHGKGLGLATCQALVEAHEGRIDIEDREGGGAIFHFSLPLIDQKE